MLNTFENVHIVCLVVWDAEGLQQAATDGYPGEADAADYQVLATSQGHPEAHRHWRTQDQPWPHGKCKYSLFSLASPLCCLFCVYVEEK